jgi:hypothetical protein
MLMEVLYDRPSQFSREPNFVAKFMRCSHGVATMSTQVRPQLPNVLKFSNRSVVSMPGDMLSEGRTPAMGSLSIVPLVSILSMRSTNHREFSYTKRSPVAQSAMGFATLTIV